MTFVDIKQKMIRLKKMSRVLKFRVWRESFLERPAHMEYIDGSIIRPLCPSYFLKEKGVTQFTGLLDKSGRDIWEGDILDNGAWRGVVEWGLDNDLNPQHQYAGFMLRLLPRKTVLGKQGSDDKEKGLILSGFMPPIVLLDRHCGYTEMEVIGNRFEHSHLLNG